MNNQLWGALSIRERKRLCKESSNSINYAYRVWDFVPRHVKADILYLVEREARQKELDQLYLKGKQNECKQS